MAQHIFLVPGFFGFTNFGEFRYFAHVCEVLKERLEARGVEAKVHPVATPPTASLRRRSRVLLDQVLERAGEDDGPIHLVGHSSGGLDARLLTTPNVRLLEGLDSEPVAARVRTVLTVATPHLGTPSAVFFTTLYGQKLLRLLSLWTVFVLRYGSVPLAVALRVGAIATRLESRLSGDPTALDQIYAQLLADFLPDRREAVRAFFAEVQAEQTLLQQLTPAAIDLFDATATDRQGVRYGSVVCRARRPGLRRMLRPRAPYHQVMHLVYHLCWRLAANQPDEKVPALDGPQQAALRAAYGELPDLRDNDGMVPVLSQVRGEVVSAVDADHLDVIGHFHDPRHEPPHFDWLMTGTGFRRPQFDRLWDEVAGWLAEG